MAGPRFLCSQSKLTFFGRPFRGPVNFDSSFGIPRQRHPQPDSQTAKPQHKYRLLGGCLRTKYGIKLFFKKSSQKTC